ncbi:MAG: hypothetical protein ACYC27_21915 [Armatimonadota bacterium]
MSKVDIWQIAPYLLPAISYIIGVSRNRLRVPKEIRSLLANRDVMGIIIDGVEAASEVSGRSDAEKREYVRGWAKSELYKLLGEWLPDSAVNYLIEHTIVKRKSGGGA